ncbi:MAG: 16S rRNA (cytidine(1402)-2'-O)-methyltransferase [Chloroflexi bacterium]|nr:16S rRNA (cytidine(1402)-2'-O)-methyltransferase [Chloroflexota bacterium]
MPDAPGTLFIVSTPIGNADDISARALSTLRAADLVVCEEIANGERLLKRYGLSGELTDLNEHNERERSAELTAELKAGRTLALVSDAGTPLLHDPGRALVEAAWRAGARVTAVPGASSLLAALVVSGLPMDQFRYAGMLPAKREARREAIQALAGERMTIVLLDAPYRLAAVLGDLLEIIGAVRPAVVACNLTMPGEQVMRGTLGSIAEQFRRQPFKGEYVILIAGAK